MQEAEELKAKGTTYWRDGDFSAAIKEWSRCIDCVATLCQGGAPSEYKDFLKIVYSNRSAAYLKTKQLTLALADSEKCISLDSRWTKGLTRRGDALLSLERHTEAYNAYTDALRYAASDEKKSLEEKSEQAMRAIRKSASEYRSNNATGLSGKTGHWLLDKISFYSQIIMIANFALYLFPFYNSYNFALIKAYLLCAIVLNFIRIYSRYGMIQFNMDYLQRVLPDNSSLNIFLCIILLSQRPYILSLLPLLFVELQEYTSYFINYGRLNIGAIQQQLGPLLAKYGGAMLRGVDPAVLMNELFSTKSIQLLNTNVSFIIHISSNTKDISFEVTTRCSVLRSHARALLIIRNCFTLKKLPFRYALVAVSPNEVSKNILVILFHL